MVPLLSLFLGPTLGAQGVVRGVLFDSLALPPLTARAEVFSAGSGAEVELATPSRATLQRAICGTTLPDDAGILRGEVRDAVGNPVDGLFIGAVWAQASVARSGVTNELIGTVDTTDQRGTFALCGVPTGTTFMVRAGEERVVDSATVSISGDSARGARVDAGGRFTIDGLPPRTTQLFVRAIGFMPARYNDFNGCGVVLVWTR
jgi:hypothetical protein